MRTIKKTMGIITCMFLVSFAIAQTEGVSIKTTVGPPHVSAMLDVQSTTKGLLIPRVALTGITDQVTVPTPANSLLIYNTNVGLVSGEGYYYWSTATTQWIKLASGSGGAFWTQIGTSSHIQYSGGNVRIGSGVTLPTYNLDVDKANDYYTARFKGYGGELRYGLFDPPSGGGPASYMTQTSTL
ncbi:MAG: hypothetical protein ABIP51_06530, partial [Bacteroidia bacterium]